VKRISASPDGMAAALAEVDLLDAVRGMPALLQLHAVYVGSPEVALVTEFMAGGELFTRLIDMGAYTEGAVAAIMAAIMRSVATLHAVGIVHRDIKPENLWLRHPSSPCTDVVIADLAVATRCNATGSLPQYPRQVTGRCGTWPYMAPEVAASSPLGPAALTHNETTSATQTSYAAGADVW